MKETIITLLGLQSYSQDKKIAKNIFYAQDDFSKHAEKLFTKDIESLSLIATLATSNTNIPALIDDDYHYAELFVLYIEIRKKESQPKIDAIIHQILPNQVLIIYNYEHKILLSVASKRKNKADKSKQVVEQLYHTDWMDGDDNQIFWDDMRYTSHLFTDLKRFYEGWLYPIIIMQYQAVLGGYRSIPIDQMPVFLSAITNYQSLQKQVEGLEHSYKNTISLGEQTKLYTQIKNLKEQQSIILQSL